MCRGITRHVLNRKLVSSLTGTVATNSRPKIFFAYCCGVWCWQAEAEAEVCLLEIDSSFPRNRNLPERSRVWPLSGTFCLGCQLLPPLSYLLSSLSICFFSLLLALLRTILLCLDLYLDKSMAMRKKTLSLISVPLYRLANYARMAHETLPTQYPPSVPLVAQWNSLRRRRLAGHVSRQLPRRHRKRSATGGRNWPKNLLASKVGV